METTHFPAVRSRSSGSTSPNIWGFTPRTSRSAWAATSRLSVVVWTPCAAKAESLSAWRLESQTCSGRTEPCPSTPFRIAVFILPAPMKPKVRSVMAVRSPVVFRFFLVL